MSKKMRNRILSFFLAVLVLLISDLPLPALSAESDEQSYEQYIGWNAALNVVDAESSFIVLDYEPDETYNDNSLIFFMDEFSDDALFRITAFKIVDETYESYDENGDIVEINARSLWYQVNVFSGTVSEDFADGYWILQNYLNAEDAYENDILTLIEPEDEEETPAYSAPSNIVSDSGVTVSADSALFTELTATETEAPTAYYINRAVAYTMTPKTETGDYTGHADVTIPIPEGWDREKLFGFVMEEDGTITALLGTVTKFGTFRFTVPHFSDVGLLEATAVDDVLNKTIVFGKVNSGDTEYVFSIAGQQGEAGRFVSDNGAVQYVVNHYTANDTTTTYISLTGLDVTPGTEIIVGNTSIIVIVKALENEVDKLLTGGTANSTSLDPLYDVGISGNFDIEYTVTEGDALLTRSGNTITAVEGATGQATVKAEIKHPTSHNVVGYVTYNVTVSDVEVTSVQNIHVPAGGTATIANIAGDLDDSMMNTSIATAKLADDGLTITSVADEGITYVVVGKDLYAIHINPNATNNTTKYVSIKIEALEHCMVYYAINGGPLYPVTGGSLIVSQDYADGFNIMFFPVPEEGYVTSLISQSIDAGQDSFNQYYSLANGSRYDGSDTDAWPFDDDNANTIPSTGGDDAWVGGHGLRWCLLEGNMNITQMRDLFARALALGCDSVTTFTKNNTGANFVVTNMQFIAERLPSFEKEIIQVVREGATIYSEDNPYILGTSDPLEIGDTITYRFTVTFHSKYMGFSEIKVEDSKIGLTGAAAITFTDVAVPSNITSASIPEAQSKNGQYTLTEADIQNYVNGQFINQATLSYSYGSKASSGSVSSVTSSSVICKINSIVTWMDSFGTVHSVQTIEQDSDLPKVDNPTVDGYAFGGWDYQTAVDGGYIKESGDFYKVTENSNTSFTINGTFTPIEYTINYELDGGTLPEGVEASTTYTIEDILTLPTPTREGYTFGGWLATPAAGSTGNWVDNVLYPGGYVLLHRYGGVTLTAQWTINTYTVTWVAEDGTTVLETDADVPYGTMPTFDGTTPSKEPTERYTFSWSPAIAPVTEDVTYTATFKDLLDYPIRIGINIGYHRPGSTYKIGGYTMDSYHVLPAEPNVLTFFEALRAHIENNPASENYQKWVADENWNVSIGNAVDFLDVTIFEDELYGKGGSTPGIYDATGDLIKKYFKLDSSVYTEILKAWIKADVQNTDINWKKVNVEDCVIIPYVIKLQDNQSNENHNAWFVDMVVVVNTTSLTIRVPDIADSGDDQTFLFQITSPNHEGFGFTVAVPEGDSVIINGLYPGKTYTITELTGWSWRSGDSPGWDFTTDGDTATSGTGSAAEITLGITGNQIVFTNTLSDPGWLGDEDYVDNNFGSDTP